MPIVPGAWSEGEYQSGGGWRQSGRELVVCGRVVNCGRVLHHHLRCFGVLLVAAGVTAMSRQRRRFRDAGIDDLALGEEEEEL